jgi:hypothetical protein
MIPLVRQRIINAPRVILAKLAVKYYEDVILRVPVQTGALRASIKISSVTPSPDIPDGSYDLPDVPTWKDVYDQLEGKDLRIYITSKREYADDQEYEHGMFTIAFLDLIKYAASIGVKLR